MSKTINIAEAQALQWYLDQGVDGAWADEPIDRTAPPKNLLPLKLEKNAPVQKVGSPERLLGASDARAEAVKLAKAAKSLEELKQAIAEFEGIALKKTATNLVFCDGNPKAKIMIVGEAPGADEDRIGKPFVGVNGQLMDKILKAIDLNREDDDPEKSVYISNILNWRPPGNRTPAPGEIEASLPFIERHIQLIQPKILIFCGGVSAKTLLGRSEGISRLRKTWHNYKPQTPELQGAGQESAEGIAAIATFRPGYLLRTPAQKKAVWADMIAVKQKMSA